MFITNSNSLRPPMSYAELLRCVSENPSRSLFFVGPDGIVQVASEPSLHQFRQMGFGGRQVIIGLPVSVLYETSPSVIFADNAQIADRFVSQQKHTWQYVQECREHKFTTNHIIRKKYGGQHIAIDFRRIENLSRQTLGHIVEVRRKALLTVAEYSKHLKDRRILFSTPSHLIL